MNALIKFLVDTLKKNPKFLTTALRMLADYLDAHPEQEAALVDLIESKIK